MIFSINLTNRPYVFSDRAPARPDLLLLPKEKTSPSQSPNPKISWTTRIWNSLFNEDRLKHFIFHYGHSYSNTKLESHEGFKHDKPFEEGYLPVGIHLIHYRVYGNPNAEKVVIFNHGGPGGKSSELSLRPYDPQEYKIILWDQRGSGKSRPLAGTTAFACTKTPWLSDSENCDLIPVGEVPDNTTQEMLQDMERLRIHLNVDEWYVSGASWGATLALLYAETYPQKVSGLILRSIFLNRPEDIAWLYKDEDHSASRLFPEAWKKFIDPLPESDRKDPVVGYAKLFKNPHLIRREKIGLAKIWNAWEETLFNPEKKPPDPSSPSTPEEDQEELASALIGNYYELNRLFLNSDNQILDNLYKIPDSTPIVILHGEKDYVCPVKMSLDLYLGLSTEERRGVTCSIIENGGHWGGENNIKRASIYGVQMLERARNRALRLKVSRWYDY